MKSWPNTGGFPPPGSCLGTSLANRGDKNAPADGGPIHLKVKAAVFSPQTSLWDKHLWNFTTNLSLMWTDVVSNSLATDDGFVGFFQLCLEVYYQ